MADYSIKVIVDGSSDDAPIRTMEGSLKRLETQTAATATTGRSLAATIKGELMGAVSALAANVAFIQWLAAGTKAAIEEERALRQLAGMARQFGQDGTAAAAAAKALGDSLQKVGYDDDQVLQDVRELLPLTRDYAQAISAVSLAYDINAKTGMPVAQALGIIQQLIAGNERGLKTAMRELGVEATTTGGALAKMETDFRGAASTLSDTQAEISAAKAELADLSKELGGPIAEGIIFATRWIKGLGQAWAGVGLAAVTAGQWVAFAGRSIVNAAKRDFEQIRVDFASTAAQMEGQWDEWLKKMGDLIDPMPGAATTQPRIKPRKSGGDDDKGKDPWLARIKERIAWLKQEQEAQADADRERARTGQAALNARARQLEQEQAQQQRADEARARSGQAALDARARQYEAELRMAEIKAEQEKRLSQDAVQGAVSALAAAFPEFKGIAVAEAIVNTYVGVTRALEAYPPPWSFIAAAAQLAYGMAQVAKIQSTEPGSGGGSASTSVSSRSVNPTVYTRPATAGGSGGATRPNITTTTNNNAPAQVVQVNALTGTQAAAAYREFEAGRRTASRSLDRRIVNRGRTTITPAGR